ncbi:GALNT2 [Symbiodinium sp. CCMP2456]|nr:GALNT2 [Symbiodinium sp. CCMP2456]
MGLGRWALILLSTLPLLLVPLLVPVLASDALLALCFLQLLCHTSLEVGTSRDFLSFGLRLVLGFTLNAFLTVSVAGRDLLLETGEGKGGGTALPAAAINSGEETVTDAPVTTLSVVVPCANETAWNVQHTVQAIWEATPRAELLEILLVDDASRPSLERQLSRAVSRGAALFLTSHRARVLRNPDPRGLLRSKQRGADAAKGDAIVFLDCHVRPMEHWTEGLLEHLNADWRRVAVPLMTNLDPDTWRELQPHKGGQKMCLTWAADAFWCDGWPGDEVPLLSGGLMALTRRWWQVSGGLGPVDETMQGWGGENLDQSLRTWLCGGEIRAARNSRVAHLWRDGKTKTAPRYRLSEAQILRNRLRAAEAWMGPWASKVRSFQEFQLLATATHRHEIYDSELQQLQRRLGCAPFANYLEHFRELFRLTGLLPESVFHLQLESQDETGSALCLSVDPYENFKPFLTRCIQGLAFQRWHLLASAEISELSVLKLWNYDVCLAWYGGDFQTGMCSFFRRSRFQEFAFQEALITVPKLTKASQCLAGAPHEHLAKLRPERRQGPIGSTPLLANTGTGSWRLLGKWCLVPPREAQGNGDVRLFLSPCSELGPKEQATLEELGAGKGFLRQLRIAGDGRCLHVKGNGLAASQCGEFQSFFRVQEGRPLCEGEKPMRCLSAEGSGTGLASLALEPCERTSEASERQLFVQEPSQSRFGRTFSLRQGRQGHRCLIGLPQSGELQLVLAACDKASSSWAQTRDALIWTQRSTGSQAFDSISWGPTDPRDASHCLTAERSKGGFRPWGFHPVLRSCFFEDFTQRLRVGNGSVFIPSHVANQGRSRFPALCLAADSRKRSMRSPVSSDLDSWRLLRAEPCFEAGRHRPKLHWRKLYEEIPLETRLLVKNRVARQA